MHSFLAMALLAGLMNHGVIVKSVANMYSQPSEEADVVSQSIYANNIGILEERDGWAKVQTADQYKGWMQVSSLRRMAASERPYGSTGSVAQVASLFANIYRQPDVTKHQPLLTVPFETRLEISQDGESRERWLEVRLPDGRSGWVQRGDVIFDSPALSVTELIEFSKRFLGLPYFWGGTSTYGFDCSGLTQMLCRRRGITIPRDASVQATWDGTMPVDRRDLQPGDLLFFGESKITHTGMYLGGGKFINATTHDRPIVQISDLADHYWTKLFRTARRIK